MARAKTNQPIARCPKNAISLEHEGTLRGVWYASVPAEHTIDDVTSPDYFGTLQLARGGLRPRDEIIVEPENSLWRVVLRVMAPIPALQQIKTREVSRQSYAVVPPKGYDFLWQGGVAKWVILHGETKVAAGFDTQDEALAHLESLKQEAA